MDWDNKISFWLKNVPYLWYNNKDWTKCKRVYLVNPTSAVYDSRGRKGTAQTFWEERENFYKRISLVRGCDTAIKNYFLVSIPPVSKRGLEWWIKQPEFPFKGSELRKEGVPLNESSLSFPKVQKLSIVPPSTQSYSLEELPDEILLNIFESSGSSVALTSKRMAGIWKEANDLRKLILKKDKRAAEPKFSKKFGYEEIALCIDTDFMYPLNENFSRWLESTKITQYCDVQEQRPIYIYMRLQGRRIKSPDLSKVTKKLGFRPGILACFDWASRFGMGETVGNLKGKEQGKLVNKIEKKYDFGRVQWFFAGLVFSLLEKEKKGEKYDFGDFSKELLRVIKFAGEENWVMVFAMVKKIGNADFQKRLVSFLVKQKLSRKELEGVSDNYAKYAFKSDIKFLDFFLETY